MFAVIDPYAALWLLRNCDVVQQVEAYVAWAGEGHQAQVAALRGSVDQLREAAAQHVARMRGSDVGTSEPSRAGVGGELLSGEMSTSEAAEVMGISAVMVRRMLRADRLRGRQVHARAWAVDRASVEDECERRRSA